MACPSSNESSTQSPHGSPEPRVSFEELPDLYGSRILTYCRKEKAGPRGFYLRHLDDVDMAQEVWYWISRYYDHPGTVRIKFSKPLEEIEGLQNFVSSLPVVGQHNGHRESGQFIELAAPKTATGKPKIELKKKLLEVRVDGPEAAALAQKLFGEAVTVQITEHRYDPNGGLKLRDWILRLVKTVAARHAVSHGRKKREGHHERAKNKTCRQCDREYGQEAERCETCGTMLYIWHAGNRLYSIDDPMMPLDARRMYEQAHIAKDEEEPEAELDGAAAKKLIRTAVQRLPAGMRAILEHVYEDGLSISKIAELYDDLGLGKLEAVSVIRRMHDKALGLMKAEIERLKYEHRRRLTMSDLPPKLRFVMEHYVLDGLNDREIAELYGWMGLDPEQGTAVVRRLRKRAQQILKEGREAEEKPSFTAETPVQDLPLNTATIAALVRGGIKTAGELAEKSEMDLQMLPGLGSRRFSQIKFLLIDSARGKR